MSNPECYEAGMGSLPVAVWAPSTQSSETIFVWSQSKAEEASRIGTFHSSAIEIQSYLTIHVPG